jgi:carboxylate-amine ligase
MELHGAQAACPDVELRPAPDAGAWSRWAVTSLPWTVGVEEEVMLLVPSRWSLAYRADAVVRGLGGELAAHVGTETHGSALELRTDPHETVPGAIRQLRRLRAALADHLDAIGLRAGAAGLHPFASWRETRISERERYRFLYASLRELARREPTFALHVHVAVPGPEQAVVTANRMRKHLPLLLALSANSPFWQGRDTGLASARTSVFGVFPRVGPPRAFRDYEDYVRTVDTLLHHEAFPDPTHLWWDVRLQPRFATVEVRIMDAQSTIGDAAALTALVQCLVRMEASEGSEAEALSELPEVLSENRFLAARDGAGANLIDAQLGRRVPVAELLDSVLERCATHAQDLGCAAELESTRYLVADPRSVRQLKLAHGSDGLARLLTALASSF